MITHYPGPTSHNPLCFERRGLYKITPQAMRTQEAIDEYKALWERVDLKPQPRR